MSAIFLFIKCKHQTSGSYSFNRKYHREKKKKIEIKMQSDQDTETLKGYSSVISIMKEYDELYGHRRVLEGVADLGCNGTIKQIKTSPTIFRIHRTEKNDAD